MERPEEGFFQNELLHRRQRLETAVTQFGREHRLVRLLEDVDSALRRLEEGSFGLCEVCHEPIESERLVADPLLTLCLPHLTPDQQRALEQDLDLASQVQGQLLPPPYQELNGWQIAYHFEPAGPVSGDYCDLVRAEGDPRGLFFFLGDVAGKGVAASMLMAQLHAMFRSLVPSGLPLDQMLARTNSLFCESTLSSHYATLVCGHAGDTGDVQLCNAGHCPSLLVRAGKVVPVEATDLPIGLFCVGHYSIIRLHLAPGDSLLLFTDGLSEARNESDEEYGTQRLSAALSAQHALAPVDLLETLVADLRNFAAGRRQSDDTTLMVLQRKG